MVAAGPLHLVRHVRIPDVLQSVGLFGRVGLAGGHAVEGGVVRDGTFLVLVGRVCGQAAAFQRS